MCSLFFFLFSFVGKMDPTAAFGRFAICGSIKLDAVLRRAKLSLSVHRVTRVSADWPEWWSRRIYNATTIEKWPPFVRRGAMVGGYAYVLDQLYNTMLMQVV